MNIDRYMVNLFFEIKRNLPYQMREPLKISNPALGDALLDLYERVDDEAIKRLIEVFFERAGDDWTKQLKPNNKSLLNFGRASMHDKAEPTKKARYYRGVLVDA